MVVLGGSTQAARHEVAGRQFALYRLAERSWPASYDSTDDLRAWQTAWQRTEGDLALVRPWPAVPALDPAEAAVEDYRTAASRPRRRRLRRHLGAWPARLRPRRLAAGTHQLAGPHLRRLPVADPGDDRRRRGPARADRRDGHYHGGRIDLAATPDLGGFLDDMQKDSRTRAPGGPAPGRQRRAQDSGHPRQGIEPGALLRARRRREAEPPTLVPHDSAAPDADALIDVDEGGPGDDRRRGIRLPDFRLALMPPYAVKVRGGDLRLFRCRLHGPSECTPRRYEGLVRFEGASGETDPTKVRGCALNESVLVSGKVRLSTSSAAAPGLRLRQCVLLSSSRRLPLRSWSDGEAAPRCAVPPGADDAWRHGRRWSA